MHIYAKQPLPDELPLDLPLFVRTQIQQVAQTWGKTTWEMQYTIVPPDYLFSCLFLEEICWLALRTYSFWIEHAQTERRLLSLDGEWVGPNANDAWLLFTPPATAASRWQREASHLFVWCIGFQPHHQIPLALFLDGREKEMAYTARLAWEIQAKQYMGCLESGGAMTDYQVTAVQQTDEGILLNRKSVLIPWLRDQIWFPDQFPVAVPQKVERGEAVKLRRTLPPTTDSLNPHQRLF